MLYKIAMLHKHLRGYFFNEQRCLACHIPFIPSTDQSYLCNKCINHVKIKTNNICKLCGQHIPSAEHVCLECVKSPPPWDALSFYGIYDDLLKALILKYKFSADLSLLPLFASYLYDACLSLPSCHMIVPMPRHDKRLKDEGFNHILEICRPLEKKLMLPIAHEALLRTRYTPPQSTLQASDRKNNPSKSFNSQSVKDKNILLIDDVITTGSTLRHASLSLRNAGAKKIYIAVIARVIR